MSRPGLDAWLAETSWVSGDPGVSADAMRSAPEEPDDPIRFGTFVGTVIVDEHEVMTPVPAGLDAYVSHAELTEAMRGYERWSWQPRSGRP